MPSVVRAFAPSKVNLALSVGAPGTDGMHPIASWMVTTRFGDDLTVKRLPPGTPSRYAIEWHDEALRRTEIDWKLAKDLAVRAHGALEQRLGRELPVQMRLQKRIPVGGGLGGGSSNAAAMLRALDALFDLRLRPQFLEHLSTLIEREQWLALLRVTHGSNDDLVEQTRRSRDDLKVTVMDRVERSRVKHSGHGDSGLSGGSRTLTSVPPYLFSLRASHPVGSVISRADSATTTPPAAM